MGNIPFEIAIAISILRNSKTAIESVRILIDDCNFRVL